MSEYSTGSFTGQEILLDQFAIRDTRHVVDHRFNYENSSVWVAVVVEWLACLPVTQKIGVRFYLERESSATSG